MQQFVIWAHTWVHSLPFSTRGGGAAFLHDALIQEDVITKPPNWLPLDGGEAPRGVPLLRAAGKANHTVSFHDEQRQAA